MAVMKQGCSPSGPRVALLPLDTASPGILGKFEERLEREIDRNDREEREEKIRLIS